MMDIVAWSVAILVSLAVLGFAIQVVVANLTAKNIFGDDFCWYRQGNDLINLKELEFAGRGFFVPNPLQQINRRFVGFGIDDPEVVSPHFAIVSQVEGEVRIAVWSYKKLGFVREDQDTLRRFIPVGSSSRCSSDLTS